MPRSPSLFWYPSPPDPVFSNRVTFEAAPGDTVEIDQVFLPEPSQWMLLGPGLVLLGALHTRRSQVAASRTGP